MFKHRSHNKELLDESKIPRELLYQNLKELETINKYLGGHSVSLNGLNAIDINKLEVTNIIDIGCGGGDSLKAMAKWARTHGHNIKFTGVDLKQDCISYAQNNCKRYTEINFSCTDFNMAFTKISNINVVHASLFFHHFSESEIIDFIKLCNTNNALLIINDLERNFLAYYSIKLLTKLFSNSTLVKNDAPLSVLRGFKKAEWVEILNRAGIKKFSIKNRWAFRHLIIAYPNGK